MRIATTRVDDIKTIEHNGAQSGGMVLGRSQYRRALHWDIEESARNLPWLRGSIAAIAKNLVAPKWKFVKVPDYENEATDESLAELKRFYGLNKKQYTNFKDFYTTGSKFYATAMAMALGNFAVWEIKKDSLFGHPMGFNFVPGYVEPNIDTYGNFKKPAFTQYLASTGYEKVEWDDPKDIVFFARPDFGGLPFASDLEALVQYTLPADIYASLSWLSMHKNRTAPLDGYWLADPDMSDENFKKFDALLRSRYASPKNYGRAPLLARGGMEFKPIRRAEDEMPYIEGRDVARQEIAGVTGVPGSKLGATRDLSMANSREAKRDYYETTIEPLQQIFEETTYEQIHVRLLGIRGWAISFNNPAFVNEVEQASIDRTYWNIGKVNVNELRTRDGQPLREGGDEYFEPTNMVPANSQNDPIQDEQPQPGTPSETNPAGQKPRPVRADEQALQDELKKWKTVAIKVAKGERKPKPFECEFIGDGLKKKIETGLQVADSDIEQIKYVFELAARAAGRSDE